MHYLGVPACPYCKKRVNLIRTWSLKRQGEYQCPRCGGISNIFLSPLVYVLALLAVFAGGAMYFFHKFVLDDISLETAVYVFIPFAVFFLLSLFMVYLEKPVIKKVSKEEYRKKRHIRSAVEGSAGAVSRPDERHGYHDEDDYEPRSGYREGPAAGAQRQGVVNQAAFSRAKIQAAVENTQQSQRLAYPRPSSQPQQQRAQRPSQPVGQTPRPRPPQPGVRQPGAAPQRPVQPQVRQGSPAVSGRQPVRQRPAAGQTPQAGAYMENRRPQGQNHTTNGGVQ